MIKILLIVWTFAGFFHLENRGQEINMEAYIGKQHVGYVNAIKRQQDETIDYEVYTDVYYEGPLGISAKVRIDMQSTYISGHLQYSEVRVYQNGKLKDETRTRRVARGYLVNQNGTEYGFEDLIHYSGSRFYFDEPKYVNRTYSEEKAYFLEVKKETPEIYFVSTGNGNKGNTYIYKNGRLANASFKHSLYTIELKRTEAKN